MRHFKHLTYTDRLRIEKMLKEKTPVKRIADTLRVSDSTIYRELRRGRYTRMNSDLTMTEAYSPDIAEQNYRANLADKGGPLKIGSDHELANYIEHKIIIDRYSPAAVLGEIQEQGLEFSTTICLHTLYSYIDKGVFLTLTNKHLPRGGKKKRRYRTVKRQARPPQGESIEKRPEHIDNREEFGHWEMDTVIGKKRGKKTLLVLTERKTRNEIIHPMKDRSAASVVKAINQLERRYGRQFIKIFKTITVDNGSEFSDCEGIERSIFGGQRTKLYYCHPYSSWERASNECANKLIRRFLPKGTSFEKLTVIECAQIAKWMNHYPRRIFGYKNAAQLFAEQLAQL